jgi:hypothetical protein
MVAQTAEQPGMKKAAAGGCASCGERPNTAALEKTSDFVILFSGDTQAEYEHAMKQRVECGCVASVDGRPHPFITNRKKQRKHEKKIGNQRGP